MGGWLHNRSVARQSGLYSIIPCSESLENGRILSAVDVMRDLVRRGVDQDEFLPRTDLEIRDEEVVLVDNTDGVSGEYNLCHD